MLSENFISSNWKAQLEIFKTNLVICRRRPTRDTVHDLRVAIKQMRCYLRLKKKLDGEKWKKKFSSTSALFRSVGKFRDFDVSLTLTRNFEYKNPPPNISFRHFLSANRNFARRLARQDAINFKESEPEIFSNQFNIITRISTEKDVYEKILNTAMDKIRKVKILDNQFQHNAHKIRKLLKDVFYLLKILPAEKPQNIINLQKLDKVLNLLGNYQDHFTLKEKIKDFTKENITKNEESEALKRIDKKLASVQKNLIEKAKKNWNEVVNENGF